MIDLHCHLLPGIDDGPETYDESLKMADIAIEQNISAIAVTHHFYDEKNVYPYADMVNKKLIHFREMLSAGGRELKIYQGAEVYLDPILLEMKGIENLCINKSRYLLIELPFGDIPLYSEDMIYHLVLKGFVPIIAHPERNIAVKRNPNLLYPLIHLGALAQVTAASITGFNGRQSEKCAKILFDNGMAHFIATDAHSPRRRAPLMLKAGRILSKWMGDRFAELATETIPAAILNNKPIITEEPVMYRKKFSFFR